VVGGSQGGGAAAAAALVVAMSAMQLALGASLLLAVSECGHVAASTRCADVARIHTNIHNHQCVHAAWGVGGKPQPAEGRHSGEWWLHM
jgi:hypothetical protein